MEKDVLQHIADLTRELAVLCRAYAPHLALCLELASKLARDRLA